MGFRLVPKFDDLERSHITHYLILCNFFRGSLCRSEWR